MRDEMERIVRLLREQFGIDAVNFEIIEGKNGKLYARKGSCDTDMPEHKHFRGIYFGRICKDGIRLSIEGSFLVGRLAKRNVIDLDWDSAKRWLSGENLRLERKGYVILRWKSYYLGCGKGDGSIVKNFIPKERRLTHGDKGFSEADG